MTKIMCVGRLFQNEKSGIPALEILVDGKTFGWLTPFRANCFQVSRTIEGELTMGTSSNYLTDRDLKSYASLSDYEAKKCFRSLASMAMNDSAGYWYEWFNKDHDDIAIQRPTMQTKFSQFIDLSINWVKERA